MCYLNPFHGSIELDLCVRVSGVAWVDGITYLYVYICLDVSMPSQ